MRELEPLLRPLLADVQPEHAAQVLAVACLSISADAQVHPAERSLVLRMAHSLLPELDAEALREQVKQTLARQKARGGWQAAMDDVCSELRDSTAGTRRAAFALAALIQYVDGDLADEEEELSNALVQCLGLDFREAQRVIDRLERGLEAVKRAREEAESELGGAAPC